MWAVTRTSCVENTHAHNFMIQLLKMIHNFNSYIYKKKKGKYIRKLETYILA